MATLKTMYGNNIPDPIDYQITRWRADPFALGAYSFTSVATTPTSRSLLAKPINNRVLFAGEATQKNFFSTVHGAYLSGVREANRILVLNKRVVSAEK